MKCVWHWRVNIIAILVLVRDQGLGVREGGVGVQMMGVLISRGYEGVKAKRGYLLLCLSAYRTISLCMHVLAIMVKYKLSDVEMFCGDRFAHRNLVALLATRTLQ